VARLDIVEHLFDAAHPAAQLGLRRSDGKGGRYFAAPRVVRFSTVDSYAVNLPAMRARLHELYELDWMDRPDYSGNAPLDAQVALAVLKAYGRDPSIVVPAVSFVRVAQLFGDLVPAPRPRKT